MSEPASHHTEFAIECRDLTKIYGSENTEVVAMRNASMNVRHGEVVALLGPSGSGKSTLLTAVGLINPPTSGQIYFDGKLVLDGANAKTNLRSFRRRNIGFVFQKSNLIPFLTAIENVQIAMQGLKWATGDGPGCRLTRECCPDNGRTVGKGAIKIGCVGLRVTVVISAVTNFTRTRMDVIRKGITC